MFGGERDQMRQVFFEAWRKQQNGEAMQPLEQMIAGVAQQHPEYHALLNDREGGVAREFRPEAGESNPFLHMAMHISLLEQVSTDRPAGKKGGGRQADVDRNFFPFTLSPQLSVPFKSPSTSDSQATPSPDR